MKKEIKDFLSNIDTPLKQVNFCITQSERGILTKVNNIYCKQIRIQQLDWAVEEYNEITDNEIFQAILFMIVKNLNRVLWEIYFQGNTLNIKQYKDPYYNVSKWEAQLKIKEKSEFIELLDLFCVKYSINRKLNVRDLPIVDIDLVFDIENTIKNINKLKIKR